MKSTSKHERQLAQQRDWFERILKAARCPKDGARVLEITMPNVVCSQCSTRYVLAMQRGTLSSTLEVGKDTGFRLVDYLENSSACAMPSERKRKRGMDQLASRVHLSKASQDRGLRRCLHLRRR